MFFIEWLLSALIAIGIALQPQVPVPTIPELAVPISTTTTTTVAVVSNDIDFWRRLANCEQRNGPNYFQFMGGTAEKVGWYAGASYPLQVAMAKDWAARIHPNEGTTSGWPVCWWVALRG